MFSFEIIKFISKFLFNCIANYIVLFLNNMFYNKFFILAIKIYFQFSITFAISLFNFKLISKFSIKLFLTILSYIKLYCNIYYYIKFLQIFSFFYNFNFYFKSPGIRFRGRSDVAITSGFIIQDHLKSLFKILQY